MHACLCVCVCLCVFVCVYAAHTTTESLLLSDPPPSPFLEAPCFSPPPSLLSFLYSPLAKQLWTAGCTTAVHTQCLSGRIGRWRKESEGGGRGGECERGWHNQSAETMETSLLSSPSPSALCPSSFAPQQPRLCVCVCICVCVCVARLTVRRRSVHSRHRQTRTRCSGRSSRTARRGRPPSAAASTTVRRGKRSERGRESGGERGGDKALERETRRTLADTHPPPSVASTTHTICTHSHPSETHLAHAHAATLSLPPPFTISAGKPTVDPALWDCHECGAWMASRYDPTRATRRPPPASLLRSCL